MTKILLIVILTSTWFLAACASAPVARATAPRPPWGTITPRFDSDANAIRVALTRFENDQSDSVMLAYDELRNGDGALTVDGVLSPFSGPTGMTYAGCGRTPPDSVRIDDGSRLWRHSDLEWECFFPVTSAEALERLKNGGRLVINPCAVWRFNTLSNSLYAW